MNYHSFFLSIMLSTITLSLGGAAAMNMDVGSDGCIDEIIAILEQEKERLENELRIADDQGQVTLLLRIDIECISNLISQIRTGINQGGEYGSSPLEGVISLPRFDIFEGNYSLIEKMLGCGANPNIINYEGGTALFYAVTHGLPVSVFRLLLERGADPDLANVSGHTVRSRVLEGIKRNSNPRFIEMKNLLDQYDNMHSQAGMDLED